MNELRQPESVEDVGNIQHPTSNIQHPNEDFERRSSVDLLSWIKHFFDYLGASREEPPPGAAFLASPLWLGIWWGVLIGLILLFCGQTSKFIYIDF
jgi:hypothetical protein